LADSLSMTMFVLANDTWGCHPERGCAQKSAEGDAVRL
jgi:hypothetical protein